MEFPPSLVTSTTKKTLLHVPVEGKAYYVDPENGTFYRPQVEQLSADESKIKLQLMTQPIGEEMDKFHEALVSVLAKAVGIPEDSQEAPADAPLSTSIPPVLAPSREAITEPAPASTPEPAAAPAPASVEEEATTDGEQRS